MFQKEIKDMSKEELEQALTDLRDSRKRNYTQTVKVNRKKTEKNEYSDLPPEILAELLEALNKGGSDE